MSYRNSSSSVERNNGGSNTANLQNLRGISNQEVDLDPNLCSKLLAFIRDKRRIAWAMISILKNNIVSAPIYYILLIVEYLELLFLYLVFAFIEYSENSIISKDESYTNRLKSQIQNILQYITDDMTFQVFVISIVAAVDLVIIITILYMAQTFESPEKAKKSNLKSKILSLVIQIKSKVLYTIEVIFLAHIFKIDQSESQAKRIGLFAGAAIALILSSGIEFFLTMALNVRVKLIEEIPWCSQKTIFPMIKSLLKLAQGVVLAVSIRQASALVIFILCGLTLCAYIYLQPFYNRKIYYIDICFLSILFAEYFHLLIVSLDAGGSFNEMMTVLLFFLSLLTPAFAQTVSVYWRNRLQNRLLQSSTGFFHGSIGSVGQHAVIKSEIEIEKALLLFTECLEKYNGGSGSNIGLANGLNGLLSMESSSIAHANAESKQICGLIMYHRERCRAFYYRQSQDQTPNLHRLLGQGHLPQQQQLCFCTQFDDSLLANRIIYDESRPSDQANTNFQHTNTKQKLANRNNRKQNKRNHNYFEDRPPSTPIQDDMMEAIRLQQNNDDIDVGDVDAYMGSQQANQMRQAMRRYLPNQEVERRTSGDSNGNDKEPEWLQEEQKQYKKGILNPVFQAEQYISQALIAQNKQMHDFNNLLPEKVQEIVDKYNQDFSILDFNNVKNQTVIKILYKILKDYCDTYPKSLRLMLLKAYFELFVMKKKYLAHQTLTRMSGEDTLSLLHYTQFQIDQQYLVEKASTLYQTKEDLLIDVDKIIAQNYHFQHFYDLIEETAFQLSLFWSQLTTFKQLDLEKLFLSGVKTSELIKQTKDKFKLLIDLGIDKRNSMLYYLYAHFNNYVLNSNDLRDQNLIKMAQINAMNNQLQDNTYKEGQLTSDVDKSGFVLVRGTFLDFGKIIYANRQLCYLLGYTPEQLKTSGRTINMLMPQLISENHHLFLEKFRETGNPTFIQRQQHLFVKNQKGYIIPFKVYIKFHYDKQYGHVFCAIVNQTTHMHPFKNKKKHKAEDIMVIMTDDDGTIYEISPAVTQNLGIPIKYVQQNQLFMQENVKIWHLLHMEDASQMFDDPQLYSKEWETYVDPNYHSDSDTGKQIYAAKHALQEIATQRAKKNKNLSPVESALLTAINQSRLDPQSLKNYKVDVKVKMVKMKHKDTFVVRYFFIELLENNILDRQQTLGALGNSSSGVAVGGLIAVEGGLQQHTMAFNNGGSAESDLHSSGRQQLVKQYGKQKQQQRNNNNRAAPDYLSSIFEEESASSDAGNNAQDPHDNTFSSSGGDSHSSKFQELIEKDIDQLIRNDKRTPKVLKQILWLVLFAFLTTTVISAVIMGMFVTDSENTREDIRIVTSALTRGIYCSQVMNLLRSLLDYQTGIENLQVLSTTAIWNGITLETKQQGFSVDNFLKETIIEKLDVIKANQQALDLVRRTKGLKTIDSINMTFVNSQQGQLEYQQQSPNLAINVIVSNIIDIISNIHLLKGNVSNHTFSGYYDQYRQVQEQVAKDENGYKVIEVQKQVFFVFQNFINVIDQYNNEMVDIHMKNGTDKFNDTQRYLILICISISTLLITLMLVSPVTFKIRRQKYQVLLFFLDLPIEIIDQQKLKSECFDRYFSSENFLDNLTFEEIDQQTVRELRKQTSAGALQMTPSQYMSMTHDQDNDEDDEDDEEFSNDEGYQREQSFLKLMKSDITSMALHNAGEADDHRFPMLDSARSGMTGGIDVNHINLDSLNENFRKHQKGGPSQVHSHHQLTKVFGVKDPRESFKGGQFEPKFASSMAKKDSFKTQKTGPVVKQSQVHFRENTQNEVVNTESNLKTVITDQKLPISTFGGQQEPSKSTSSHLKKKGQRVEFSKDSLHNPPSNNESFQSTTPMKRLASYKSDQDKKLPEGDPQNDPETSSFHEENQVQEEKELIQEKIKQISSNQRSSICIIIMFLFIFLTGYFIGIYVYATVNIKTYRDSFSDLRMIHDRSICLTKLFFLTREDLLTSTFADVYDDNTPQSGQQGYHSASMDQLWYCMNLEQAFTDRKRDKASKVYMKQTMEQVDRSEKELCEMVGEDQIGFGGVESEVIGMEEWVEVCRGIQNGMLMKGMSLVHQDFVKQVLITLLDYFSKVEGMRDNSTERNAFILQKLRQPPFLEYLYTNQLLLTPVNSHLSSQLIQSIYRNISTLKGIHISIFSALQVFLIIITLHFFSFMFNRMKKDMLSSHLMIALLPKMRLSKVEQVKIRDFLLE